jgi:hypothetical protein
MVAEKSVLDVDILVADLRRSVEYAARAGLLRDREVIEAIRAAEQAIEQDRNSPDVSKISAALNSVAQAIAPVTVADLSFGRDPFSPANQRKGRRLQFWLTVFCLVILLLIGYSMNALRVEQGVIGELNEIQELHPELKLTALRMIAEKDEPIAKRTALFEEYHQKVGELKQINGRMALTYTRALEADGIPLFPLSDYLESPFSTLHFGLISGGRASDLTPPAAKSIAANSESSRQSKTTPEQQPPAAQEIPTSGALSQGVQPNVTNDNSGAVSRAQELCAEDVDGTLRVPQEASHYPKWMRIVLSDTLSDFCFQLKVLSPDGQGTILNQAMDQLTFVNHIKDKVSLRVSWFLPFLYGLLGSAVFLMRNVASVRTPSMEWFPIVMRLSLGGVAGIIMGWFSASTSPTIQNTTALSLPFALAFLTGYGIDALFTLLDSLNRTIGDIPNSKR